MMTDFVEFFFIFNLFYQNTRLKPRPLPHKYFAGYGFGHTTLRDNTPKVY